MDNGLDGKSILQDLRDVFATGRTKRLEWRVQQLKGLSRFLTQMEKEVCEALKKDLNKPYFESYTSEIATLKRSVAETVKRLPKLVKPEKVSARSLVPLVHAKIVPEPLGVCLIVAPWNYPVMLCLEPMVGALSAGNCVVLKPSEIAAHTSALIAKYLPMFVDSSAVKIVEGGVSVTTQLLAEKWDKIFYTGNGRIGRIIMEAAAKHLTPVTLELGGKSPVIIDSTADINVTARRISWGKWASNNGQTCIAPDYILAEEEIVPKLIRSLKNTIESFYGEVPQKAEISRIINEVHFGRIMNMLNDERTCDKVVYGGHTDENDLYIAPTIILDPPEDSPIMEEEIFGPLLVIITVKSVDKAIKFVNSKPKPLALYVFSKSKAVQIQVIHETSSGGVTVNDVLLHVTASSLPFGGVGESGMGAYHGPHSFNSFSHKKPILYRGDNGSRYPLCTKIKQRIISLGTEIGGLVNIGTRIFR